MRLQAAAPITLLLGLATVAHGQQNDLAGPHQYPQFRVLSGLPGGGFGVLPDGRPSIDGAAALTTPIGYSLGGGHGAMGIFNTTSNGNPFGFDGRHPTTQDSNGTATFMTGGSYAGFHGSASYMVLSTRLDGAFNFQISPPLKGRLGASLGVQDLSGAGGASGRAGSVEDRRSSRSYFAVGTYDLGNRAYVSLGVGDRRFHGAFGNASAPVANRLRAVVEYDAYNFNGGLIYDSGPVRAFGKKGRPIESNIFVGAVRAKYLTVGLSLTI